MLGRGSRPDAEFGVFEKRVDREEVLDDGRGLVQQISMEPLRVTIASLIALAVEVER